MRSEPLTSKPGLVKCRRGLTVAGLQGHRPALERADEADWRQRAAQRAEARQRAGGAGPKGARPALADDRVFSRVYCRVDRLPTGPGLGFWMGQPPATDWIQRLRPGRRAAVGDARPRPQRSPPDRTAVWKPGRGRALSSHGPARPRRRPQDRGRQARPDSGQQQRHPVKQNRLTDQRTGTIKALRPPVAGTRPDQPGADETRGPLPTGSPRWNATGVQGDAPQPGTTVPPPQKPQSHALAPHQQAAQALLSSARLASEHRLGGLTVFRLGQASFRTRRPGVADLLRAIACALPTVRLDHPLTA
jgi:hypothetical protein